MLSSLDASGGESCVEVFHFGGQLSQSWVEEGGAGGRTTRASGRGSSCMGENYER